MCAVGCRKALELAVKWVYAADKTMKMPYKDNLQSLIHEPSFRFAVDSNTWGKLPFIIRLGNLAVHTERSVQPSEVLASLKGLFEFAQWIDYCYGSDYQERVFDESLIPTEKMAVDTGKSKSRKACWMKKRRRLRRCANRSSRCPPNIPPGKRNISRSVLSSRRICPNSRREKFILMWI